MAEQAHGPTAPTGAPGDRGRLDVRTKALQHLAEQAALEVTGTVVRRHTLGALRGGNLPRASVTASGHRARVELEVAAEWPAPLARIASEVRGHVSARLAELGGLEVVSVDVTVDVVTSESGTETTGRVA